MTAANQKTQQTFYYGWIVVAVAFVTMGVVSAAWFAFSLFYPPILHEFGWTRSATAGAYSLNLLISSAASPIGGYLVDKFGPRIVMPAGAVLFAVGFVGSSRIHQMWEFYFWFGIVAALGFSAIQVVPNAALVSNWFSRNRATAMGIIMSAMGLGRLVLFPLIQFLITHYGWRAAYVALAGIIVVTVAPINAILQRQRPSDMGLENNPELIPTSDGLATAPKREPVVVNAAWAAKDWTLPRVLGTYRFWALALLVAVYSGGVYVIVVQEVSYLGSAGYSSLVAASFIGLQGLLGSGGSFLGGALSDRIGRERSFTLSIAIFIIGIASLALVENFHSSILLYSYALFFGVGFGMGLTAILAAAADLFQGRHFGSIFGAINFAAGIGNAAGAFLGGYIYDLAHSYRLLFLATMAAVAISTAFIWIARPASVRVIRRVGAPSGQVV